MDFKFSSISILLLIFSIFGYCQNSDSAIITLEINKFNQYLDLNGTNEALIDNGIRCFKKSSIGEINDSIYRIWELFEPKVENNMEIITLRLLELGKNDGGRVGQVYTLSWTLMDTVLKVVSINKKLIKPKSGWNVFDSLVNIYSINKIHNIDFPIRTDNAMSTFGLSFLQFVDRTKVSTMDFSTRSKEPLDNPTRIFLILRYLIYTEFPGDYFDYMGEIPAAEIKRFKD